MDTLESVLHWLGYGLCHQLPERSYIAGGLQAPVCVRDSGIYLGFVIAAALIVAVHRGQRPRGFPRPYVWVVMGLLVAFMAWDGVSSYGGLRETTNTLRLMTGLGVGFSVAAVVMPMLNDVLWRTVGATRVLDPVWRFGVWLAALPLAGLLIGLAGLRLGPAFPILIAVSILVTLSAINLVIVAMLPWFDRRAERIVDIAVPSVIALALSLAEIAVAGLIRGALETLARQLGA